MAEGIVDGSCRLTRSSSCFQLVNKSFDEDDGHCSLDLFPIQFEEASFPAEENCLLNNSDGQDVYRISVVPDDGYTVSESTSDLSVLEVPNPSENQMCLDAFNYQSCIDILMDTVDDYLPCVVDIDLKNEKLDMPKSVQETSVHMKSDGVIPGVLRRQGSMKIGESFMQLLMDYGSALLNVMLRDKSMTERANDSPNRWRRYKRSASFDSRRIVLLFSILSSMGTLVLIYLTLRVRQTGDAFVGN